MDNQKKTNKQLEKNAKDLHGILVQLVKIYQFRDRNKIQERYHRLSVAQYYIIAMIVENGPVGIIDLSKKLFVDKSTISRVVDLLIEKDYINKETSLTDSRAIILNVTDKGRMVYQKIERIGIDDMMKMLERIDPKASRTTIKIITALVKKATKQYL